MQKKRRKGLAIALCLVILFCVVLAGLENSTAKVKAEGVWRPDYDKVSIEEVLEKAELTDADYELLYEQTGLTKLGVDGLKDRGLTGLILQIQSNYFAPVEIEYTTILPYVLVGKREDFAPLCWLEDGDIIISQSTTVAGVKVGHSALVVDGENARVLESTQIGTDSGFVDAGVETLMSSYMVLRPTKIPENIRRDAVDFAKENLVGIPYNQLVGLIPRKFTKKIKSTQCAHLCWYAYKKFGYDLDSNGGLFVAPKDIANSSYLEVVQIYGFDPENLWK